MRIKKKYIKENFTDDIDALEDNIKNATTGIENSLNVNKQTAAEIVAKMLTKGDNSDGEEISEHYGSENIVQFHSELNGEEPFMINGEKWVYVNVRKNDGHIDVGVYRFGHDLAYDYEWFHNNIIPKPKNNSINEVGDDYRDIEVGADEYDDYEVLKGQIRDDIAKEIAQNSINKVGDDYRDINYGEKDLPFESRIAEGKIKRKVIKKIKVKNFK